jgi:hypothetical protein
LMDDILILDCYPIVAGIASSSRPYQMDVCHMSKQIESGGVTSMSRKLPMQPATVCSCEHTGEVKATG